MLNFIYLCLFEVVFDHEDEKLGFTFCLFCFKFVDIFHFYVGNLFTDLEYYLSLYFEEKCCVSDMKLGFPVFVCTC